MIGIGQIGRIGGSGRRSAAAPPADPDFSLTNSTVATSWGVAAVGELVPSNAPPGAYFVLVGNPAGFAVENG